MTITFKRIDDNKYISVHLECMKGNFESGLFNSKQDIYNKMEADGVNLFDEIELTLYFEQSLSMAYVEPAAVIRLDSASREYKVKYL